MSNSTTSNKCLPPKLLQSNHSDPDPTLLQKLRSLQKPEDLGLGKQLGHGSFGTVFLCEYHSIRNSLKFAVKRIHSVDLRDSLALYNALRDLKSHLNIAKIYHFFVHEQEPGNNRTLYLCLELCESNMETLLVKSKGNPQKFVSVEQKKAWLYQLLQGIDYAHSQLIVHRNISTANVLLSKETISGQHYWIPKFTDWSTSKSLMTGNAEVFASSVVYLAPESWMMKHDGFPGALDIWALGLVFLQIWCVLDMPELVKVVSKACGGVCCVLVSSVPSLRDAIAKNTELKSPPIILDMIQEVQQRKTADVLVKEFDKLAPLIPDASDDPVQLSERVRAASVSHQPSPRITLKSSKDVRRKTANPKPPSNKQCVEDFTNIDHMNGFCSNSENTSSSTTTSSSTNSNSKFQSQPRLNRQGIRIPLADCDNTSSESTKSVSHNHSHKVHTERREAGVWEDSMTQGSLSLSSAEHSLDFHSLIAPLAQQFVRDNWPLDLPPVSSWVLNPNLHEPSCVATQIFAAGYRHLHPNANSIVDPSYGIFGFHGCSDVAIGAICSDGFDPLRRSRQVYGKGEYFSPRAAVSIGFAKQGNSMRMMVCFLLTGSHFRIGSPNYCYVVENPMDMKMAFNIPVLIISTDPNAPRLTMPIYEKVKAPAYKIPWVWEWAGDSPKGKFVTYLPELCGDLEKQYSIRKKVPIFLTRPIIRLNDGKLQPYSICFSNMTQSNASTAFVRRIQRVKRHENEKTDLLATPVYGVCYRNSIIKFEASTIDAIKLEFHVYECGISDICECTVQDKGVTYTLNFATGEVKTPNNLEIGYFLF